MLKRAVVWVLAAFLVLNCLCASASYGALIYGQTNDDIMNMQRRLQELEFFLGECDGCFDDETKIAVENFQIANGFTASGKADDDTMKRMMSQDAITKSKYIDNVMNSTPRVNMTLSPGDKGRWVKQLQNSLEKLGYFDEKPTGYYGSVTEDAVMFFQLVNGLSVTGIADPDTLSKISSPSAIPAGDNRSAFLLKYGDSGSDVKALQTYLKRLGYFSGECTGKFGNMTQSGVYAYQRSNGLELTGECDLYMRILILSGRSISKADAEAAEAVRELCVGDDCDSVRIVKMQLTDLGFYSGVVDTVFNDALINALRTFQTANDLEVNGNADTPTRMALNARECISYEEYENYMSISEVSYGDEGFAVTLLQQRLKELEYYSDAVDGVFNRKTQSAVLYFQRGHLLTETGVADENTRQVMNQAGALTYAEAEEAYNSRMAIIERELTLEKLLQTADDCVAKLYEAGKTGPQTFSGGGLMYYCYSQVGIVLEPTISLQLERAREMPEWNEHVELMQIGSQVFLLDGQTLITGIYIGEDTIIYAYAANQVVVASNSLLASEVFKFVGSVMYF